VAGYVNGTGPACKGEGGALALAYLRLDETSTGDAPLFGLLRGVLALTLLDHEILRD
jgi:hypothetical protein